MKENYLMTYPEGIINITNEDEQSVAILLHNLGFDFVKANLELKLNSEIIGEIDLLFTNDKFLFLIEVSKGNYNITNKKNTFFNKWENETFLKLVRDKVGFPNKKIFKIYFDFTKNDKDEESLSVNTLLGGKENCIIGYENDFAYFLNSYTKIGKWARNDFLDWIKPNQDPQFKQIIAIQYYIQDIPVYCFVENVSVLLNSCYVQRRRRTGPDFGYQRMLDGKRTANIKQNIESSKGLSFPNSILISSKKLSDTIFPKDQCPKITTINFPLNFCSCRIIDGQHRLLGFSKLDENKLDQYFLPVIALPEINPRTEFTTFIDINSKQQKMDNNLILNLKADWSWPENSSERIEQKCVLVAKKLNETVLKDRIYFGSIDETKGDKITLVTIKSTLIMNNQVLSTVEEMFKKFSRIFKDIREVMPQHVNTNGFFQHNQGFRFLFRLVNLFERNKEAEKITIDQISFFKNVSSVMTPTFLEHIKEFYGTGSGGLAANELIVELKKAFPKKYRTMEEDLKKLKNEI